jgi:hypothetical protein
MKTESDIFNNCESDYENSDSSVKNTDLITFDLCLILTCYLKLSIKLLMVKVIY